MQKPVLTPFRLGGYGQISMIAVPQLKSPMYSPNHGVLHLKVFDNNDPDTSVLHPINLPAIATEEKLSGQVLTQLAHDEFWNHFFPGLPKTNRAYNLSIQSVGGKLSIGIIVGSKDAFSKFGIGICS